MRSRISSCLVGAVLLFLARDTGAFELKMPILSCEGHEFLAVQAALNAGIPPAYHDSFLYGVRYPDLGTRTMATATTDDGVLKLIHENEPTQHHHFCLRGNATDLTSLVKDTAAWIQKLHDDAQATPIATTQLITDGALLVQGSRKTVNTRFFLLGAALHAIQDSFAHGARTPVYGPVKGTLARTILAEWGGPEGRNFTGLYTEIREAVLYPDALPGTAVHNAVYTKDQGSGYKTDKVWNAPLCDAVTNNLGNLQPHAFAAYLASLDFVRAFQAGTGLNAFFKKWFGIGNPVPASEIAGLLFKSRASVAPQSTFPGLGNAKGKCSTANFASSGNGSCLYLMLPGESEYPPNAWGSASAKKFALKNEECSATLPCAQLPGAPLTCTKDGPAYATNVRSFCTAPLVKGVQKPKLGEVCALDVGCVDAVCAKQGLVNKCLLKAASVCASDADCGSNHCTKATAFAPTGTCS